METDTPADGEGACIRCACITQGNKKALAVHLLLDPLENLLDKLIYLYLSIWKCGLYHFHKVVDSKEGARKSVQEFWGQKAGAHGFIFLLSDY